MDNESNRKITGAYDEIPSPLEKHVINYMKYFGSVLSRWRNSQPRAKRTKTAYGEELTRYYGKAIERSRLTRAENGDPSVAFGVFSAYLNEMGLWPNIIAVMETGDRSNLHYLSLIHSELSPEIEKALSVATSKLNERAEQEKSR